MASAVFQILTANRLADGDVVYWRGGSWVESFAEGETFPTPAGAEAALAAAQEFVAKNLVVNPYLFEVRDHRPVKEREIIRAAGPTVRADLGKQAEGLAAAPADAARDFAPVAHPPAREKEDDVSI
jgi:hypothetical protein